MRTRLQILPRICLGITLSALATHAAAQQDTDPASRYSETIDNYCVTCHNQTLKTAGLMLDRLDLHSLSRDAPQWEKVLRKLRNRQMPPAGAPRPEGPVYDAMIRFIEGGLNRAAAANLNPGRPAVHRLNRAEYANAIRDLLALEIDSTAMLPADDIGYGFDNIADVLTVSPFLMERYLRAAARISRLAVGERDSDMPPSFEIYELPRSLDQSDWMGEHLPYGSRGGMTVQHYFPVDGEYLIKVRLQTGRFDQVLGRDRERRLDIRLDGKPLGRFTVEADERATERVHGKGSRVDDHLEARIPIKAGTHTIAATFIKDAVKQEGPPTVYIRGSLDNVDRAFFEGVGSISVGGPYEVRGPGSTASRERIFSCYPEPVPQAQAACAREILGNLAHRAYRRPVTQGDLSTLLELYQEGRAGGGFETGVRMALQKILVSPDFLFRMEFDPSGVEPGQAYHISDLELASRLSFFLWSSIPDEALLASAERGELRDPDVLAGHVQRMLADPRSSSLITNFVGQWLFLRNMERVLPDPLSFPRFDDNLRLALQKETELLFESMLREDRSVVEILDSDYTFLNERLAEHYGIEGIYGPEFRRVSIRDERRRGLLGQGSILTVTSYPNRTAPTIRGKWILEQVLGTPPPPPPPDVPSLKQGKETQVLTMRERMEMHRANPACAVCHKVMDPIGFALENFDGLGRWRETNNAGRPIDASGTLPDGTAFQGPPGLRRILLDKEDLFVETFIERLLTYALGRGVEYYDLPVVRKIRHEAAGSDHSWSAIITGIVNSVPFQMRKAAGPDGTVASSPAGRQP